VVTWRHSTGGFENDGSGGVEYAVQTGARSGSKQLIFVQRKRPGSHLPADPEGDSPAVFVTVPRAFLYLPVPPTMANVTPLGCH
jgi:hypothetical protein